MFTEEQEKLLCEDFDIDSYMLDADEQACLMENNIELHNAYQELFYMSKPEKWVRT